MTYVKYIFEVIVICTTDILNIKHVVEYNTKVEFIQYRAKYIIVLSIYKPCPHVQNNFTNM